MEQAHPNEADNGANNDSHRGATTDGRDDTARTEDTAGEGKTRKTLKRPLVGAAAFILLAGGVGATAVAATSRSSGALTPAELLDYRTLDGSENNLEDPSLGQAGTIYTRVAEAVYADGIGEPVEGPAARYLSNRIFNGSNQNVFSENGVTHWSFVWGQFIDHTIGLRAVADDEQMVIPFDADDPLESFTNDLGAIATTRSAVADGTGVDTPREQVNTVSSYIDGWSVYGGTDERLDWLRDGTLDGDPTNNEATLMNEGGYLPTAASRPNEERPSVELQGQLIVNSGDAVVAGDERANENLGLTAVHTLFLREHNRIVEALPDDLDEETKFQVARRVIAAMQQYITYEEFLPAMGVDLDRYEGYDPTVDPSITNEFATVGYRAHSAVHGEFEMEIPASQLTEDEMAELEALGVELVAAGDVVEVAIPLNVAFGNPTLLPRLGLGNMLAGLASEAAYNNDEQIDNQLRSVLFQIPRPDAENPLECLDGESIANCFSAVNDLGVLDVARAYDHGMPSYNEMRQAYGLEPVASFAELTGESSEEFPDDPEIDQTNPIDDPDILDFVLLADGDGNELEPGSDAAEGETVTAIRRTTLAARLKAVFGSVDDIDAFTGMISEPHVAGTEFGELQLAMWTEQFAALRDGDRFYYGNDPVLDQIRREYGIDYRQSLGDVIAANADVGEAELPENVFLLAELQDSDGTDGSEGERQGRNNGRNDGRNNDARDRDDPEVEDRDRRGSGDRPRRGDRQR